MRQTPEIHRQAAQYCTLTVGLYTIIPRRTTVPKKLVSTPPSRHAKMKGGSPSQVLEHVATIDLPKSKYAS